MAMKHRPFLVAWTALCICLPVAAQWQWVDKTGRVVFSDRAPPPDIPESSIRKRPHALASSVDTPANHAVPAAAVVPRALVEDKALMEKKRQAMQTEAAQRQQQENDVARIQAENCQRARRVKAGLDAGQRQSRLNDQGEREFLDEAGLAAEAQRLQAIIERDCR